MGLRLFSSSSKDKSFSMFSKWKDNDIIVSLPPQKCVPKVLPNPNPSNYKILKSLKIGNYLIIKIKYLDCTNYEGNKILVFKGCTLQQLKKQKDIDPHFCDNKKFISPIARFKPTKEGWNMAVKLCKL